MNSPATPYDSRYTFGYTLECSTTPGQLTRLLQTVHELDSVIGLDKDKFYIAYSFHSSNGDIHSGFLKYAPSAIKKLIAGRMTEEDYFQEYNYQPKLD